MTWCRMSGKSSLVHQGQVVATVVEHTRTEWRVLIPSRFGWEHVESIIHCPFEPRNLRDAAEADAEAIVKGL